MAHALAHIEDRGFGSRTLDEMADDRVAGFRQKVARGVIARAEMNRRRRVRAFEESGERGSDCVEHGGLLEDRLLRESCVKDMNEWHSDPSGSPGSQHPVHHVGVDKAQPGMLKRLWNGPDNVEAQPLPKHRCPLVVADDEVELHGSKAEFGSPLQRVLRMVDTVGSTLKMKNDQNWIAARILPRKTSTTKAVTSAGSQEPARRPGRSFRKGCMNPSNMPYFSMYACS